MEIVDSCLSLLLWFKEPGFLLCAGICRQYMWHTCKLCWSLHVSLWINSSLQSCTKFSIQKKTGSNLKDSIILSKKQAYVTFYHNPPASFFPHSVLPIHNGITPGNLTLQKSAFLISPLVKVDWERTIWFEFSGSP